MVEWHLIFKGKVQGVGFRWTVVDYAEKNNLVGAVKNLSNGDVEVVAQGSEAELETFVKELQQDPGSARIDSIKKTVHQHPTTSFKGFRILH